MILPNELLRLVENAYAAVLAHPQHDLNLGYRRSIWAALGPRLALSQGVGDLGLQRRTTLAILSTQYVLPIWESVRPNDDTPQCILIEAKQVLSGDIDLRTGWEDRNRFWEHYVNMGYQREQDQIISGVGFSAVQALTAALQDEIFDPVNIDLQLTDGDVDSEEADSAFFAAAVYANGTIWEPDSDAAKRGEFWEWWLRRAVPIAWNSA